MSVTTTYTCDRCGKSQTTPDQMWRIGLHVQHYDSRSQFSFTPANSALWCRGCVEERQLTAWAITPSSPTPPPTLEDQLLDIIRTIVQEEIENAR